jgi:transmembrane sensor
MSAQNNSARQDAAEWHVRLASETANEGDWLEFERWMAAPKNKAAYEALEAALMVVDAERSAVAETLKQPVIQTKSGHLPAALWATGGAALAAAAAMLVLLAPSTPQEFAYAAPAFATRTVKLPDASVIQLNRGASVRVRLDGGSRQLVLERGEAAFAVAHDAARPFTVAAGLATVRDVGTEFDVVRASSYALVTVREGQVSLTPTHGDPVSLGAGQQGRVDQNGAASVARTNAEDAFGWQSGRLIYRDAPLSQIVEDLNRYSQKPVVIADDRAGALRFTGVLVIDNPASMVERLQAFLPIQSAQNGDRIELRSRP